MKFNYDILLKDLNIRKFGTNEYDSIIHEDKQIRFNKELLEDYQHSRVYLDLERSKAVKYIIGSMLPVPKNYTQQIISNRKSIENTLSQLNESFYKDNPLEFRGQGSVSNNTHIKRNSDIDLLVIIGDFITLEPGLPCPNPYQGNPIQDLLTLRKKCIEKIQGMTPPIDIDDTGSKSIKLKNGHLVVDVDIVPSNWYDTKEYNKNNLENERGIMILDKNKKERILNFPFKFNALLAEKDGKTAGIYKKAIRLLKNIKTDSEKTCGKKIKFSSYGIYSLLYTIEDSDLHIGYSPLTLIDIIYKQISRFSDSDKFTELKDPLKKSLNSSANTIEGLRILQGAVQSIKNDLKEEISLDEKIYLE